jgi:hypothetical protein
VAMPPVAVAASVVVGAGAISFEIGSPDTAFPAALAPVAAPGATVEPASVVVLPSPRSTRASATPPWRLPASPASRAPAWQPPATHAAAQTWRPPARHVRPGRPAPAEHVPGPPPPERSLVPTALAGAAAGSAAGGGASGLAALAAWLFLQFPGIVRLRRRRGRRAPRARVDDVPGRPG